MAKTVGGAGAGRIAFPCAGPGHRAAVRIRPGESADARTEAQRYGSESDVLGAVRDTHARSSAKDCRSNRTVISPELRRYFPGCGCVHIDSCAACLAYSTGSKYFW